MFVILLVMFYKQSEFVDLSFIVKRRELSFLRKMETGKKVYFDIF